MGYESSDKKGDAFAEEKPGDVTTSADGQTGSLVIDVVSPPEGMVLIPAGEFLMGSKDSESNNNESPVHRVYLDAFYMDTHEVTNMKYQRFVLLDPECQKSNIPDALHDGRHLVHWNKNEYTGGQGDYPVVHLSWYAAMVYAGWMGKRLPTEAEWAKAARGASRAEVSLGQHDFRDRYQLQSEYRLDSGGRELCPHRVWTV